MSVLEHEWFIILEPNSAHDIEQDMHRFQEFNPQIRFKILPLTDFNKVVSKLN